MTEYRSTKSMVTYLRSDLVFAPGIRREIADRLEGLEELSRTLANSLANVVNSQYEAAMAATGTKKKWWKP